MEQKTGNIGITTENIFPVIKKFLYSDHDIFLREVVSNAVDATQKLKTLVAKGIFTGEVGELSVRVSIDKENGTLTISDSGIGMSAEEIDKYINQIAFSGANEFLEKYKDDNAAIIGHFGLGFYSTFMVAKKVEIVTKSYVEDAPAVKWECDGTPAFSISDACRSERGTDIILYIDDDNKEFLDENKIKELLEKYCHFLPIPIIFGKKKEWKDGKYEDTTEDNVINVTEPLWTKSPQGLKDDDYKAFYRQLYPMSDDPLFWIHLNVDYPFNLTGVLYFPKIKSNTPLHRNKIQLYCNQVYVTDQVDNIVPEFLTLLHGVIDSPDIPLNVSRSYLQSDANVKKISSYITKKVSDRLASIAKSDKDGFESKWDDLKLFIHYGMLSQNDFYKKASTYALLKDVDGKYYNYSDYKELIKANQTDKDATLVVLYATDAEGQYSAIHVAKQKGYNVLLMDGQLDSPLVSMLEQKWEKTRFVRVDSDTIERLIPQDDSNETSLNEDDVTLLTSTFNAALPKISGAEIRVDVINISEESSPVCITQSEYMRRMKDMSKLQEGMSFYGEMPDMYNLVLNANHPIVVAILDDIKKQTETSVQPIMAEIRGMRARQNALTDLINKKSDEAETKAATEEEEKIRQEITDLEGKRDEILSKYVEQNNKVSQLMDLALLQQGLLKGESLTLFVNRSIDLLR